MRSRGFLLATCRLVLALYPSIWRARYGAELEDVLEQHRVTPSTVADLAISALRAHRNLELGLWRRSRWLNGCGRASVRCCSPR